MIKSKPTKVSKAVPSDVVERKDTVNLSCTDLANFKDLSIGDKVTLTVVGVVKSLNEHQYDKEETRRDLTVEIDSYDVKKSGSEKGKRSMEKAYETANSEGDDDSPAEEAK